MDTKASAQVIHIDEARNIPISRPKQPRRQIDGFCTSTTHYLLFIFLCNCDCCHQVAPNTLK